MGPLSDLPPNQQRDSFLDSLRPHLSAEALEAVEAWAQERVVEGDREALGLPRRLSTLEEAMEKALPRVEAVENAQPDNAYRRKVKDGHHHEQAVEGMDDQVSQGFGYQLDAVGGIALTRGSWPNNRRLTISGAGFMNIDYVVDSNGAGTHTALYGASGALADALTAGGVKTIWLCSTHTEPVPSAAHALGAQVSTKVITIWGAPNQRSALPTSSTVGAMFTYNKETDCSIRFQNIRFTASILSSYDIFLQVAGGSGQPGLSMYFDNCNFDARALDSTILVAGLSNGKKRLHHCTGSLTNILRSTSSSGLGGDIVIEDCAISWDGRLDQLGDYSGSWTFALKVVGGHHWVSSTEFFVWGNTVDAHFRDLTITFTAVGGTLFAMGPNGSDKYIGKYAIFQNVFVTTNRVDNRLIYFDTFAALRTDEIVIDGFHGRATGSSGTPVPMIEIAIPNAPPVNLGLVSCDGNWSACYEGLPVTPSPAPPHLDFFNGTFVETLDADISEAGGVVTLSLQQAGTGDLTMRFSDGFSILDCTPAATIALTVGDDDGPQANYIYIPIATKVLTKSTSQWPATEHIKVGYYLIPSAAFVQNNGPYIQQQWNDHRMGTDNMGHMAHMAQRERLTSARYFSGISPAGTSSYLTIVGATVYYKATSGVIFQMHAHASAAVDTDPGGGNDKALVVNWNGDAYHDINNLFDIVRDSGANLIGNNKWFNLVIWGVANKAGTYEPAMINLPSGFYNTQASAEQDISGFDNFDLPREFDLESSTAFLIARLTIQKQAGTWAFGSVVDLRRGDLLGARGGASSPETEFPDNTFNIFDATDNTKILAFQLDQITAGNTRTLTAPDADGIIALTSQSDGTIAHGTDLSGVGGGEDDHTEYLLADGSRELSGDWEPGNGRIIGNYVHTEKVLSFTIGDAAFGVLLSGGSPLVVFDTAGGVDSLRYDRAGNVFEFNIGGGSTVRIDASGLLADVIAELGAGNGVTIDGLLIKDGAAGSVDFDDTDVTAAELEALTDGSDADSLHSHPAARSEHTYVFVPDAAKGDDIAVGDQQGILHHSGDQEETVTAVYLDAETAPTGASLIIVVEFGDTDDLDTVGAWTTIDTVTLTATNKSVKDSTPTQATLPANRLIRMNVTQVGSTVTGKDAAVHVKVKRKLTT
jgi:hypothetical protein